MVTDKTEPETLTRQALWGGACSIEIPPSWQDVSQSREVPDYQEVWADPTTDQSLLIDLLDAGAEGTPPSAAGADALVDWYWSNTAYDNSTTAPVPSSRLSASA